jgi:hypothetical protein
MFLLQVQFEKSTVNITRTRTGNSRASRTLALTNSAPLLPFAASDTLNRQRVTKALGMLEFCRFGELPWQAPTSKIAMEAITSMNELNSPIDLILGRQAEKIRE